MLKSKTLKATTALLLITSLISNHSFANKSSSVQAFSQENQEQVTPKEAIDQNNENDLGTPNTLEGVQNKEGKDQDAQNTPSTEVVKTKEEDAKEEDAKEDKVQKNEEVATEPRHQPEAISVKEEKERLDEDKKKPLEENKALATGTDGKDVFGLESGKQKAPSVTGAELATNSTNAEVSTDPEAGKNEYNHYSGWLERWNQAEFEKNKPLTKKEAKERERESKKQAMREYYMAKYGSKAGAGAPPSFLMKKNKIFIDFGFQETFIGTLTAFLQPAGAVRTIPQTVDYRNSIAFNGSIGYNRILNRRFSVSVFLSGRGRGSQSWFFLGDNPSGSATSIESTVLGVSLGINILQKGGFFMAGGVGVAISFVHVRPYSTKSQIFQTGNINIFGIGAGVSARLMLGYRVGKNVFTASLMGTIAPSALILGSSAALGWVIQGGLVLAHDIRITDLIGIGYSFGLGAIYMKSSDDVKMATTFLHGGEAKNYYFSANIGMNFSF